jgi:hypothetical protein
MWSSFDVILRAALVRPPLSVASLQIVASTIRTNKRTAAYATDTGRAHLVITMTSALAEALTCKRPLHPESLTSLVKITAVLEDTVISDGPQSIANGLTYLRSSPQLQSSYRPSIDTLLAIAKWILHWSELYPQVFTDCLKSYVQVGVLNSRVS